MSALSELMPTVKRRVIDLVEAAGVDVSDWANVKGGERRASVNPKYCYEWSFVQTGKVVVLNMWHKGMRARKGAIVLKTNVRKNAWRHAQSGRQWIWRNRADKLDKAIQTAFVQKLPVRVIVLDGETRSWSDRDAKASRVEQRELDPMPWAVTSYDSKTGRSTLTRGARPDHLVDQFSLEGQLESPTERHQVTGTAFSRNPDIRRRALQRAKGCCEWCARPGFAMSDGRVFLETHDVIPLGDGGADRSGNVVALCPNHHREAHHGAEREAMRRALLDKLKHRIGNRSRPN